MTYATGQWRKSSRSNQNNNNNCVEARLTDATFQVRDSKLGDGSPILAMTDGDWQGLLSNVRH